MQTQRFVAIVFLLGSTAYASSGHYSEAKASTVKDTDVGRLQPEQEKIVDDARLALATATDDLAREQLKLEKAEDEARLAKTDVEMAEAEQKAADARQMAADESRALAAITEANQFNERARMHRHAADAHVDFADKQVVARKADVQAAEQQVALAEARVESARLAALQRAQNPAATTYDPGRFETAVYDAQIDLEQMQSEARSLDQQAAVARSNWQSSQREFDAHGGLASTLATHPSNSSAPIGKRMLKVVPRPTSVVKLKLPPCFFSTMFRAMAKP
jgi:hypothetical protein